ncbi:MAG: hypothetical protein GC204_18690 [Chloroflexi bacterium]|nr:hypothetical protein [Chloroflexota bacterium]
MSRWFRSPYRVLTVAVICVALTLLALLIVVGEQGMSERTIAASLLVLTFTTFEIGGILFTGRAMQNWPIQNRAAHLRWERSFVILPTVLTMLGLVLLADLLRAAGDSYLAQLGMATYLFAAALVVVAETTFVHNDDWNYPQVVAYVVLALLAQAAFGVALLQTGLLPAWVGWATLIWNLGYLLIILIARPREVYYPAIHYVAPLLIGIAMVASGWG